MMRYIKFVLGFAFVVVVFGIGHYTLPQNEIVRVVNAEVRRVDLTGFGRFFWSRADTGLAQSDSRDVRFIETIRPNGKPLVFRNEDTGWSWPPYFKFDSANLQASVQDLVSTKENPEWVAVRHYGWRSDLFSAFPNAVAVTPVAGPDVRIFPWRMVLSIGVVLLIILGLGVIWRLFRIGVVDPIAERLRAPFQ